MPRMELVRVEDMPPDQRAQYDRFPSNLSRALLLTDGRLAKALPEVANALRASGLDAKLREALILRVAALSGSAYERMQHLEQARKFGPPSWPPCCRSSTNASQRRTCRTGPSPKRVPSCRRALSRP
jgi:hypothetical protein